MAIHYNPIVRTFGRLRAVLVNEFGVPRECVRPDTRVDTLFPPAQQGRLCARLRLAGLPAPEVGEHEVVDHPWCILVTAIPGVLILGPMLAPPIIAVPVGLLVSFYLAKVAFTKTRTRTVSVELIPQTIGQLVLALTRFGDHPDYRFSREEIAFKGRLVVAERLGVAVDEITEETNFITDFV